ncbi:hypothetical protein Tco_1132060 [Tanacetum coccineum]|uniref:Transmembrane protein n=1 Tax=Tanacetum coccineum TaxID=301880 RepID=A0ABQ5JBF6_9ASTR
MSSSALEAPWMSFYFVVFVLVRNIVRNEFVASKVVGVGVSVDYCGRGLKNRGGGGIVVVKLDVILGIAVA